MRFGGKYLKLLPAKDSQCVFRLFDSNKKRKLKPKLQLPVTIV